jgi:hypothetical protein
MTTKLLKISQAISKRIKSLQSTIEEHRANIELLTVYSEKAFYCSGQAMNSYIPKNEHTHQWTITNLTNQILLLEAELDLLEKYSV